MRITKRQLRKIIKEVISESQTAGPPISGRHAIALGGDYGKPPSNPERADDRMIIAALQDTWNQVRMDVGISRPTPEDKSDEAMAMIQTYYPELTHQIAGKSNTEIDELLQQAFGRMV